MVPLIEPINKVNEARESISKLEFRFQDILLARIYNSSVHSAGWYYPSPKIEVGFDKFA